MSQHKGFFERAGACALSDIAAAVDAKIVSSGDGALVIDDVRSLSDAGPTHLSFLDNRKYLPQLLRSQAGACLISPNHVAQVPPGTTALVTAAPYRAFARAMHMFYADALFPKTAAAPAHVSGRLVDETATIGEGVTVEPGAVVGREAVLGRGTTVAAGAVIGYRVTIGCNCYVGPGVTVTHAVVGDRVILHAGARVGQDGFGFAIGRESHLKIPHIGRVVIGDDVEIGANSTIDRGSLSDTIIGAGTKIDNLVQIGHNVVVGRHCLIVAQSGIAGSAVVGDFVVMGAHSGIVGHVKVGAGAQIAGMAHVKDDVLSGARMGGTPARPFKEWAREIAMLKRMSRTQPDGNALDPEAPSN